MRSPWRKSSYSGGDSSNCVEVASEGGVLIRDTTNRDGVTMAVSASAWTAFLGALR